VARGRARARQLTERELCSLAEDVMRMQPVRGVEPSAGWQLLADGRIATSDVRVTLRQPRFTQP
jgi:hypothetical protein